MYCLKKRIAVMLLSTWDFEKNYDDSKKRRDSVDKTHITLKNRRNFRIVLKNA